MTQYAAQVKVEDRVMLERYGDKIARMLENSLMRERARLVRIFDPEWVDAYIAPDGGEISAGWVVTAVGETAE